MRTLLDYLSRYTRKTRMAAIAILFVATIVLGLYVLAQADLKHNDVYVLYAVLVDIVFAFIVTPIIVSLLNEQYEAQGVHGMFIRGYLTDRYERGEQPDLSEPRSKGLPKTDGKPMEVVTGFMAARKAQ